MRFFNKNSNQWLFMLVALGVIVSAKSTEYVDNQYVWKFLSGESWPSGYQQSTGKPENLSYHRDDYPKAFFERINNALPESIINEAFLTNDDGATIVLQEEGEVFVTFIHEGAGYRNSFGYFTFDPKNPPNTPEDVSEIIVFPNLSFPHMTNGHRLSLGSFPAGTHIGFFIAANGYWYDTGVKPFATNYYYSLQHLNPEVDPALRQHVVLLYDEDVEEVIMGFEDLPRTWGDNDFNDAVFSVKVTPETALATTGLVSVPDVNDSDADGVEDSADEFPDNYRRAFSTYFPAQNSVTTLAFEDNWPKNGDYDLNDLVLKQRVQTVYDAQGTISGLIINGQIAARGANDRNGFAMRLMGIAPQALQTASLYIDGNTYKKSAEDYQSDLVIQLWNDSHIFTETGETGRCSHFNTLKDCDFYEPINYTLDISFKDSLQSLPYSSLDFFIFKTNDRSLEVHFAGYPPTDLFDTGRFGRQDDTSSAASSRYFKNATNLPWALQVNHDWHYPREYIDILWAYPDFERWVESNGSEAQNWFTTSERTTHYYVTE